MKTLTGLTSQVVAPISLLFMTTASTLESKSLKVTRLLIDLLIIKFFVFYV